MDTREFFSKLLPEQGWKILLTTFNDKGSEFRRQLFKQESDQLADTAVQLDTQNKQTVYFALASFKEKKFKGGRAHANALSVKAFWLDVDCGEGKDYPSQRDALVDLVKFIKASKLPKPMIVSSGNGIHVYWPLTKEIPATAWRKASHAFKAVVAHYGFKADPSRTADVSSVLRPIGTHHRKGEPKLVTLLKDADAVSPKDFIGAIVQLVKTNKIVLQQHRAAKAKHVDPLNAALASAVEYPPSDANQIAKKCGQITELRDTKGDMEEPLWYAGLGVVAFCEGGEKIAHMWSKGHPQYDAGETDVKLEQISKVSPTTCNRFESLRSDICATCDFKGKITSPIQLGVVVESAPAPELVETKSVLEVPHPFKRAKDGLYVLIDEIPIKFFDRDLYPSRIIYDEQNCYEEVIIKYNKPIEGVVEFRARVAAFADSKKTNDVLLDNGVIIGGQEDRKRMASYILSCTRELQKQAQRLDLFSSMGWKDEHSKFVLGSKIFEEDGGVHEVGMSSVIKNDTVSGFSTKGSTQEWVDLTEGLDDAGMEAHAFTLLVGFGAPLMKFTGLEAALINLIGTSGTGKSTMQRWVNSIYGDTRKLAQSHEDTDNAKFLRASIFSNLPVTIDEITNIDAERLSSFVYRITQGRDRARLSRSGTERAAPGEWNTLLVSSSNESLLHRLTDAKTNPEAEAMRLFEYWVPTTAQFKSNWGKEVAKVLRNNYGGVGEVYIRHLVQINHRLEDDLERLSETIIKKLGLSSTERYWAAAITCSIYGGLLAKKLGIIKFDVNKLLPWLADQISQIRDTVVDIHTDGTDLLGQYLMQNIDYRVIIDSDKPNAARGLSNPVDKEPRLRLHIRDELHNSIIYVDRAHFNKFVATKGGDISTVKKELKSAGLLLDIRRYSLSKGLPVSAPHVYCYVFDRDHSSMGDIKLASVTTLDGGTDGRCSTSTEKA